MLKLIYPYIYTMYNIQLEKAQNAGAKIEVDGTEEKNSFVSLINDRISHKVKIFI